MSGDAPEGDTVVKHDRKVTDNNSVSSVVEHTTCTREVMGSIPTGVSLIFQLKIVTVLPPSNHPKIQQRQLIRYGVTLEIAV